MKMMIKMVDVSTGFHVTRMNGVDGDDDDDAVQC